ncbi:MAG: hypothetical protein JWO50_475, partial [Candidatus Kaiserbacteria bacterium]|nr:hypothetical protein [Candidatus Kaiserbacteria bacterium]
KLSPISYHWNQLSGLDTTTSYSGFSAQNVQTAIPEAVGSSTNGFLTLQDRPILAATVNAIKDIGSIGGDFRHALITWLGASDNGLSKVRADQICAKTSAGTDVCMTGDQMQTLLNQQYQSGGIGGTPTPSVSDNVNLDASSSETVPPDSTQSSDILITQ